jgi:TRAP-type mannitol/chloroaromatic compound transport system permease large subunit
VSVESIFASTMPYVVVMLVVLLLIAIFPAMALALT